MEPLALTADETARYWNFVAKTDDAQTCWLWQGSTVRYGYGQFRFGGTARKAHHAAWILGGGQPRGELSVLHKCDNPPCVNPAHLFLGTQADNVADMDKKGRRRTAPGRHGSLSPQAKLTDDTVDEVRRLSLNGMSQRLIAAQFGVHISTVKRAVRGHAWKTRAMPCADTRGLDKNGRPYISFGSANGRASINEADVLDIRALLSAGLSQSAVARHFGISRDVVSGIKLGRTWERVHGNLSNVTDSENLIV